MEHINLARHFNEHLIYGEQLTMELVASNLAVNTIADSTKHSGLLGDYSCNHTVRINAKTDLFHYEFVSILNTSLINGAECMNAGKLEVLNFMPTFINSREVIKAYPAQLFTVSNADNTTGTNDDKLMAAIGWLNGISNENDKKSFDIDIVNFSKAIINQSNNELAGSGGFNTPEYQLRNAITNKINSILQAGVAGAHEGKIELMYAVYNIHNQGVSSVTNNLVDMLANSAIPSF